MSSAATSCWSSTSGDITMSRASRSESRQPFSERDLFVIGLQVAAGLMMAQQIGGKAARDGMFLLHYGPNALPGMITAAAAFAMLLSMLNGRVMRRLAPRSIVPCALGASGVLQILEWW